MRPRLPVVLSLALFAVVLSLASAGWLPGPPAEANASPPPRAPVTLDTTHTDVCPVDGGAPLAWPVGMVASALRVVPNAPANEYVAFGLRYNESDYANQESVGWRVDANGAPLGSPVAIGGSDHQAILPVVAFSPTSNRYLAVTSDVVNWNTEHAFPRLQARLLQPSLTPSAVNLSLGDLNPQSPAVAYDTTDDEFLVVWADERYAASPTAVPATSVVPTVTPTPAFTATPAPTATSPPRELAIYAARIRGNGTVPPGGETRRVAMLGATGGAIGDMQLAYNSVDGEYLAVWTRDGALYGQRLSRAAEAVTAPAPFGPASAGVDRPRLAYNSADNQYLVVWSQTGTPSALAAVVGMTLSSQAVVQSAPFTVQATPGYTTPTDLAYNPVHHEYLLSWVSSDTAAVKPSALRLAANGAPIGDPVAAPRGVVTLGVHSATGDALLLSDLGHRAQQLDFAPCAARPSRGATAPSPMIARTEQWFGQVLQVHGQHHNGASQIFFRPLGGNIVQVFGLPFSHVDERLAPLQDGAMVWLTATRIDDAWYGVDDLVVLPSGFATPTPGPTATATPGPSPTATLPDLVCPRPGGAWLDWPEGRNVDALRLVPHAHGGEYLALTTRDVTTDVHAIVGQRLSLSGASLAAATDILTDTLAARPAAAYSPTADRTLLVWGQLERQPTHSASRLRARAVAPDLAPVSAPVELGSEYAYDLSVAYNPDDDEFLVVWREERWTAPAAKRDAVAVTPTPLPTVNQGIYAQRVRTDGTPIGTPIAVTVQAGTMADGQLTSPRIQYNSHNHGYLIVWGNSRAEMFTRRIGRTGALPGAASTLFEGWGFELAYNSVDNEYLLAYLRSEGPDGPPGSREVKAYARRLTAGGAALGDEAPLPGAPGYAEIRALAYNGQANEYLIGLRDRVVRLTAQASVLGQPVPVVPDVLGIGMTDGAYLVVERWGYLARGLSFQPHCAATPTPEPGAPTPTATPSAVPALVTWQGQVQAIQPSGDGAEWTVEGQTALVTRLTRIETYAGPAGVGARVAVAAHDQNGRRVADAIVVQPSTEPPYRLYLPLVRRGE